MFASLPDDDDVQEVRLDLVRLCEEVQRMTR